MTGAWLRLERDAEEGSPLDDDDDNRVHATILPSGDCHPLPGVRGGAKIRKMPFVPPSKEELYRLYVTEKLSPEKIGERYSRTGRSVRNWMKAAGIDLLGPSHLRLGKPATWNKAPKPAHVASRLRTAAIGKIPWNKGSGIAQRVCARCRISYLGPAGRRLRFCGRECTLAFMTESQGESHWNYTGKSSRKEQTKRHWVKYQTWRYAVMARDNRTCLKCGGSNRVTVHHKNNWSRFPDQRFDVANGVCLCKDCHWSFHRKYGHKFCTAEMLDEWLTMSQ
jgi:hypothetical protein